MVSQIEPAPIRKLTELISDIKVAMLTTVADDGSLRSRPMATPEPDVDFDGTLWFFTREDSAKVEEVQREQQVNVSFADPERQQFVSISGRATISHDHRRMARLWSPALGTFFPQGLDDPDIALLRVEVDKAEYWDRPSGGFVKLMGFVRSLATGERYQKGENRKVNLERNSPLS